nr:peptide chain release factor N(5)-glutamine methyltransferase [Butyrivibrio sp.]
GEQEFMGLSFKVSSDVLIPNQDTETLVEEALRYVQEGMRVLDLCTGSGCIALSLLNYSNGTSAVGTDISINALQIATKNSLNLKLSDRYKAVCADLYSPISENNVNKGSLGENNVNKSSLDENNVNKSTSDESSSYESSADKNSDKKPSSAARIYYKETMDDLGKFDIIVSNPPYIPTGVIDSLEPEVKVHEPFIALDGKEDGLFFYRKIIDNADKYLLSNGWLIMEIGYDQGEAVSGLMTQKGFKNVEVVKDLGGNDRVVLGCYY